MKFRTDRECLSDLPGGIYSLNQSHQCDEEIESRSNLLVCFSNYQIDLPEKSPQEFDFSARSLQALIFFFCGKKSNQIHTDLGEPSPSNQGTELICFLIESE